MTLEQLAIHDNQVLETIHAKRIQHFLAKTDKGILYLVLDAGHDASGYQVYLDAVPVSKDAQEDILKLFDGRLFNSNPIDLGKQFTFVLDKISDLEGRLLSKISDVEKKENFEVKEIENTIAVITTEPKKKGRPRKTA